MDRFSSWQVDLTLQVCPVLCPTGTEACIGFLLQIHLASQVQHDYVGVDDIFVRIQNQIDVGLLLLTLLKFVTFPFLYAKVNKSQV